MTKTNIKLNTLFALITVTATAGLFPVKVYADDCEPNYGGGETCLVNKRFKIEKWVRLEGEHKDDKCEDWDEEVTIDLTDDDEKDKYVEFCVKVKNLSDDEGDTDFDDMKMKDILPDELKRIGGDGLTEYWDDFEPGESKKFYIKVELEDDEKDRDGEFEKCAVNKAEVYWDDEFEGSDTATVCWKNYDKKIKELPKTGEPVTLGVVGTLVAFVGALIKKGGRVFPANRSK